jgi:hypothetical protein
MVFDLPSSGTVVVIATGAEAGVDAARVGEGADAGVLAGGGSGSGDAVTAGVSTTETDAAAKPGEAHRPWASTTLVAKPARRIGAGRIEVFLNSFTRVYPHS